MRFEERELPPYAEPVPPTELKEGAIYFSVTFVDDEMRIPTMQTLVFIGRKLNAKSAGTSHFQDIDSYRQGIRSESAGGVELATFLECAEDHGSNIFEYEKALNILMLCSLRRRGIRIEG